MDGHLLRYNQNVTYAFIDLETFSLNLHFYQNRPWQVGIIKVRGEKVVDAKDIRVNWPDAPHLTIGKQAAIITRFDPILHSKLAVTSDKAFPKFWPILKEVDYIVMHNGLRFDLYLLKWWAKMMGEEWQWMVPKIIDTKSVAQGIEMGIPYKPKDGPFMDWQYRMANMAIKGVKTNLKYLGQKYGIAHDYDNLHDAICDLELNLKVWNKMKYQTEI